MAAAARTRRAAVDQALGETAVGMVIGRGKRQAAQTLPVTDPYTEQVIAHIPDASPEDVDLAVRCARGALPLWASMDAKTSRRQALLNVAEAIEAKKEVLAAVETADCGKPFEESVWDMEDAATAFRFYAEEAARREDIQRVDVGDDEYQCHIRREPLGVIAAITPWNYPMLMAVWKVAPALAAGCTVVLKPSEHASLTCLLLGEIVAAHCPAGVLNVVTGCGSKAGNALASHPDVDKVGFTGSVPTGRLVAHAAAASAAGPKPVGLELGGKSPAVVFADAVTTQRLDDIVEWVLFGFAWTNGQICSATSRLLVQRPLYDAFIARLRDRMATIRACDPMEDGCRIGPVVTRGQYDRVLAHIDKALAAGARVASPGGAEALKGLRRRPASYPSTGYFVPPLVLTDVATTDAAWREEIFGPVVCARPFDTEADALALANDNAYGLASAVFTSDASRAERFERGVRAGIVWVSCSQPCFCQMPWGGYRSSGYGRDLGAQALENYTGHKSVVRYAAVRKPLGWYPSTSKL